MMNILPSEIIHLLENFRSLMRIEVFETLTLLIPGLPVGEAKHGTVRASVFVPADYRVLTTFIGKPPLSLRQRK